MPAVLALGATPTERQRPRQEAQLKMPVPLLLIVAVMIAAAGCGTPARTAATQPGPPARSFPDTLETKPFRTYRVAKALPPSITIQDSQLAVDRTFKVTSTFHQYIGWQTSRTSVFVVKGLLSALDQDLSFGFSFTPISVTATDSTDSHRASTSPLGLSLLLKNESQAGVQIDWNAVTLIRSSGRAYPVLHKGVKFNEAGNVTAPSTVPPGATLTDFVFPREAVFFVSGRYGGWSASQFFEGIPAGETFSLYLPVRRGSDLVEYQFTFQTAGPGAGATAPRIVPATG
jgi:hypothetical protein